MTLGGIGRLSFTGLAYEEHSWSSRQGFEQREEIMSGTKKPPWPKPGEERPIRHSHRHPPVREVFGSLFGTILLREIWEVKAGRLQTAPSAGNMGHIPVTRSPWLKRLAQPAKIHETIEATAGAWKDLLDCEAFERDICESRLSIR